jgi:hypothetical protein
LAAEEANELSESSSVLYWEPTRWRAVQKAAWRVLNTRFARDYSVISDSPE